MKRSLLAGTVAIVFTGIAPAGCGGGSSGVPSDTSSNTTYKVFLGTGRPLDMLFMIDNSTGMPPMVSKMNAQFPKLISALKDPVTGALPDLRIAIIDSDLGTGTYSSGSCAPKTLPDGTVSPYGDFGLFQMLNRPNACTFNAGDLFLEYEAGHPVNYTGDINTVFACLAGNLGPYGCGEEHQLQAFEFALVIQNNMAQQQAFLRGNAYLGLVFLTDEDDCSAAGNDGMFGDKPELLAESASLRCATRGHMCGGSNLTNSPPGYPTDASFTHAFSDCQARMGDECPTGTDTSLATQCNPLRSVKSIADEIKALKADPDNQILVAGIFGWPLSAADMATATYKIAPIPNPNTADTQHPTVFDLWPVCYDPDHMPSATSADPATGFDATAAGWGAAGGLRLAAFVDQFGANGLKFSICQRDFSDSMSQIGATLAKRLRGQCLPASYAQYASCAANYLIPSPDPRDPRAIIYTRQPNPIPLCDSAQPAPPCYSVLPDAAPCAAGEFLVQVNDPANPPVSGQMLGLQCE